MFNEKSLTFELQKIDNKLKTSSFDEKLIPTKIINNNKIEKPTPIIKKKRVKETSIFAPKVRPRTPLNKTKRSNSDEDDLPLSNLKKDNEDEFDVFGDLADELEEELLDQDPVEYNKPTSHPRSFRSLAGAKNDDEELSSSEEE